MDAGLILQLDSPDLGLGRHMMYSDLDEAAYLARIERHVEALNFALAAIPADRVRMHVCWGNYQGPHHKDVPLATILLNAVQDKQGHFVGLTHFITYFQTPSLLRAAWNSIWVATVVVLISVPVAFVFAYALTRSCIPTPLKATFRLIALIPLLAPSLLSAISFVQWFGNQGALKFLLGGASIYGAPGIILAEVYNTFPHALMILVTALSLADGRLYEAAAALRTRASRQFMTITLPSCKYGLASAATVVGLSPERETAR